MPASVASVAGLLAEATSRLAAACGLEPREARLEARVLAGFAWQCGPAWLIAHAPDPVSPAQLTAFDQLLQRRLQGEPVAHITGTREFYGRLFHVTRDVLIPRPETELLVDLALERMPAGSARTVLDLGTGSGCLAITLALERPNAQVTAVDRAPAALAIARGNAARLGAAVAFLESDWFDALAGRRFDIIVGNPPYIAAADPHLARGDVRFEPLSALVAGNDGLDDLRRLIAAAPRHLAPGGSLLLEHGYDQAVAVRSLLLAQGFEQVRHWDDLAGIARVSGGSLSE